jgi:hypothetical protein
MVLGALVHRKTTHQRTGLVQGIYTPKTLKKTFFSFFLFSLPLLGFILGDEQGMNLHPFRQDAATPERFRRRLRRPKA